MSDAPIAQRDAHGRFVKGVQSYPNALHGVRTGNRMADIIKKRFDEPMEIYLNQGKTLTTMERKEVLADVVAQLVTTGEVNFPDRPDPEEPGKVIKGKKFHYSGSEWAKQLIRILRYVQPPVQEVMISPGGVEGVRFDKEFADNVIDIEPDDAENGLT